MNGSFSSCQNYGITWKVCIVEIERDIGGATRVRVHTVTTLARATPFFSATGGGKANNLRVPQSCLIMGPLFMEIKIFHCVCTQCICTYYTSRFK